jgi:hypothetical protein
LLPFKPHGLQFCGFESQEAKNCWRNLAGLRGDTDVVHGSSSALANLAGDENRIRRGDEEQAAHGEGVAVGEAAYTRDVFEDGVGRSLHLDGADVIRGEERRQAGSVDAGAVEGRAGEGAAKENTVAPAGGASVMEKIMVADCAPGIVLGSL